MLLKWILFLKKCKSYVLADTEKEADAAGIGSPPPGTPNAANPSFSTTNN